MAILQLAFALAAILWLAVFPLGGAWRWVQALGVGLCLLALRLVGLWLWPSIWTPHLLIGLWLIIVVFGPRRGESGGRDWLRRGRGARRDSGQGGKALALVLVATGAVVTGLGIDARRMPDGPSVDISFPLGPGNYWVAQGGARRIVNDHLKTLDPDASQYAGWRGQSYAVDLVAIDEFGRRKRSGPAEAPESYRIFGRPVLAPCSGAVVAAEGGSPDMPVPQLDRENLLGNHVIVDCDGVWIVLAHLLAGSTTVATGDQVRDGERLGAVGNSGNSAEPHLHVHAQTPGTVDAPISGDPVWLRINGRFPARGQIFVEE